MKKPFIILIFSALLFSACSSSPYTAKLTRADLETSLELGTEFLLANQKAAGNFNYSYNFETDTLSEDDNQVRQAGALWGLSLLYAHQPSEDLETAIVKAFNFYGSNPYPEYPGDEEGKSGSLALLCLSLLDFLSTEETPNRDAYETQLQVWMDSLLSLQNEDLEFYGKYEYVTGAGKSSSSPYSDGEALLALSKAANYFENDSYFTQANEILDAMWTDHVENALEENPDSDETKGFYQWVTMSLYELDKYQTRTGKVDTQYTEKALELADWMIDTHKVLERTRNTAYAFEGLIASYNLAALHNEEGDYDVAIRKLYKVIDSGLHTLTTWQVGHPLQNEFIATESAGNTLAQGGVTNAADEGDLRIDVTQHQMHVVIMALEGVY